MAVTLSGSGQVPVKLVYVEKKDSFVGTSTQTGSGYYIDVTGMSASITPSSSANRILIVVNMYIGMTTGASGYQQSMRIRRNGTYPTGPFSALPESHAGQDGQTQDRSCA